MAPSSLAQLLRALQATDLAAGLALLEEQEAEGLANDPALQELLTHHFQALAEARDTDALTGLRHTPGDHPVVAFIDLQDFRHCNRERGHAGGNEVLCAFARGLEQQFGDAVFRVGGDEFVVGATHSDALRRGLAALREAAPWPFVHGEGSDPMAADADLRRRLGDA